MIDGYVFYLCKGGKSTCSHVGCCKFGGECKWTTDPEYAINGPYEGDVPPIERFEPESFVVNTSTGKKITYYWEREPQTNEAEDSDEV